MTSNNTYKRARAQPNPSYAQDATQLVALHRSRLFDWQPSAVVAISACPGAPLAAVGHESGDLELWDLGIMACIQRIAGPGVEVTSLTWALDNLSGAWRAFAAHLDGSLSEVLWKEGRLAATIDSAGGAVWAMSAQPAASVKPGFPHLIAAACDDGGVRLFAVEGCEEGMHYSRSLTSYKERALAVCWHPNGHAVVVGGVEGLAHVVDVTTGRELMRLTISSSTRSVACLWQLLVLPDGTIVSGDSEGAVQFWDGHFGTLLHRFQQHQADVLALSAAPDGSSVFAAGVDAQVAMFSAISNDTAAGPGPTGSSRSWAYLHYKRPHTHDVRAMATVVLHGDQAVLLSGGVDSQLIAYPVGAFLQQHPVRLSKAPQRPLCQLALGGTSTPAGAGRSQGSESSRKPRQPAAAPALPPRLLCAHNDVCDVWQLAQAGSSSSGSGLEGGHEQEGDAVELVVGPRHLARIKLGVSSRVVSAAVSPDGRFVACCSSSGAARLYQLSTPAGPGSSGAGDADVLPSVRRVSLPAEAGSGVLRVALTNSHLITTHSDGSVSCSSLPDEGGPRPVEESEEGHEGDEGRAAVQLVGRLQLEPASGSLRHIAPVASKPSPASWRDYHPAVGALAVSPDATLLAAAGPAGISLVRLPSASHPGQSLSRLGSKPLHTPHDSPVAALAFSADGGLLAAALAGGGLAVYDMASGQMSSWCLEHEAGIAACLDKLPGPPVGLSFSPDPRSKRLLVWSSGGFCHFDVSKPPNASPPGSKRQRSKAKPAAQPAPEQARGSNGRAVLLSDPCVYVAYLSAHSALLLEKPWEDILKCFAPPLYKHRYGV